MGEKRTSGGTVGVLAIVVVALSVLWVLIRPDLWAWVVGVAVITITMLTLAHDAGKRRGCESVRSAEPIPQGTENADEKTIASTRLEAFDTAMAEANLFAYELEHGLVPDGNSRDNPGYGPMDFNEWQEWKRREFERTANLWSNHPGGVPPREGDAA